MGVLDRRTVVYRRLVTAPLCCGALLLAAGLAGCGGPQATGGRPGGKPGEQPAEQQGSQSLLLVSYSVTKGAYDKILPQFKADWKRRSGQDLEVKTSYGGSGSQTRAVIDGLDADLVTLALPADVLKALQLLEGRVDIAGRSTQPPPQTHRSNGVAAGEL